ncbi:MAG: endonuclease/exonuclease/phosphatase family protein [Chitinophagales bacterium]|nr:endonuclease/exonuclease/phosphatase family protein [Chitinophagales bacterium]
MKWGHKIILFFTILAAIALVFSYAAMYTKPTALWWISFFGLAYFPIIIVNLIFLFYWLFVKRKVFVILLIIVLMGWKAHASYFAFAPGKKEDEENAMTILTWNVKGLDAYNPDAPYQNRDLMIQTISDAKPDIICLQEFNTYQNESKEKSNLEALLKATGLQHYYYFKAYENKKKTRSFGLIIFSRYPIQKTGVVEYNNVSKLNTTIYADVDINGKTIRVFTSHLQSTQLTHRDLEFVQQTQESDSTQFDAERVAKKLNTAFQMRVQQCDSVANALEQSPYPVVLCGDFNDTPVSYTYQTVSENLQDAFLQSGLGIGGTFVALPFLRIDYMLFDEDVFTISGYKRIKTKTSDHYPVVTMFQMAE